jgi:predicted nucleic acid-binding protein
VLQSGYGFRSAEIAGAFRRVAGLSNVFVENPEQLAEALDLVGRGLDFADALHLVAGPHAERFCTFDRALIRTATAEGLAVAEPDPIPERET